MSDPQHDRILNTTSPDVEPLGAKIGNGWKSLLRDEIPDGDDEKTAKNLRRNLEKKTVISDKNENEVLPKVNHGEDIINHLNSLLENCPGKIQASQGQQVVSQGQEVVCSQGNVSQGQNGAGYGQRKNGYIETKGRFFLKGAGHNGTGHNG